MSSRLSPLLILGGLLFVAHLTGCDTAPGMSPEGSRLHIGTNVVHVPAGYEYSEATVVARPGGERPVLIEADQGGRLDAYFTAEGVPRVALDLDLYDADAPSTRSERPVRLRQVSSGGLTKLQFSMANETAATVEYVSGDGVAWVASYAATDSLDLGNSEELVESVHYKEDEKGRTIIIYDFSDGEPLSVTTPSGEVIQACREIRVSLSDIPIRLGRPALEIGGAGWQMVRVRAQASRAGGGAGL